MYVKNPARGQVLKTNSRVKLIALSVFMIVSLGAAAAPAGSVTSEKQEKGQYVVRQGETLAQIAARVRPADATLNETIQVLAKANTHVFKNGNIHFMRVGDVLVIPSSLEFAKLNTDAKSSKESAADSAANQKSRQDAAVSAEAKKELQGKSSGSDKQSGSKENQETGSAASQEDLEGASSAANVSNNENEQVVGASAASEAAQSEENSGSSFLWIMFGALLLLALMGLSKLRGKGNGAKEDSAASEKETTVTSAAVGAVAAEKAVTKNNDESLFFNDVEKAKMPEEAPAGDVDIDLSSLNDQGGIVSGSVTDDEETKKRLNANWDEIESTESVYEEEPRPTRFDSGEEVQDVVLEQPVVDIEDVKTDDAEIAEKALDETPLELQGVSQETVDVEVSEEINQPVSDEAPLVFEMSDEVAENQGGVEGGKEDVLVEAQPVDSSSDFQDQELDIPAVEYVDKTVEQADQSLEFNLTETEASDDKKVEVAEEAESEQDPLSLVPTSLVVDSGDSVAAEEDFSNTHITEADENTVIEWDSVQFGEENEDIGFVSESVGMTAPLEAKYELAQMYIEIGDPDAARETLNELVEEANGDILAKSKALLDDLN